MLCVICTYTEPESAGHGPGLLVARLDPLRGELTARQTIAGRNPAWMAVGPRRDRAYVVHELATDDGRPQGTASSWAVDAAEGTLARLNQVPSGGRGPAHCSVHPTAKALLVAHYGSGHVAALPIGANGALAPPSDARLPMGRVGPAVAAHAPPGSFAQSGHDATRAHMAAADPSGRWVLSTDLGQDITQIWTLADGRLGPHAAIAASLGGGPRHFAFHPTAGTLYVLQEEASELAVWDFDARMGTARAAQLLSTLPEGFAGTSFASALALSADGRFLYAGNRLHNSVAIFGLDASGHARLLDAEWTRGDYPNHIALDPTGRFLLACNRRSDQMTVFRVDIRSGRLAFTGQYFPIGSPNMICFIDPPC